MTENNIDKIEIETLEEKECLDCIPSVSGVLEDGCKVAVDEGEWVSVDCLAPYNEESVYWVLFDSGVLFDKGTVKLCRLNNYKKYGGYLNYWQDMASNDLSMRGTMYIECKKPEPPKA